ncbi:MAG: ABC transporter ATP-binding protein [Planctomycetes bacterium]|nr:ABC transporter ATP-binding protein [Planctomycetota bacterium]
MPVVIELENVSFVRQGHKILSGVHWWIETGQHWALMGANGSGKTTLLKIITGYEWPTSGQVKVLGKQFGETNIPELRKHIGWVSTAIEQKLPIQDCAIDVVASGLEASLGLFRDFTPEEYARAEESLKIMKAEAVALQSFNTLSQGEQQRVLIARALVNRPKLLILDEPCAGLDPAARMRFLRDLERLAAMPDAPAIIFVTHHLEEIGGWMNQALLLKDGKVIAVGSPKTVFTSENMTNLFDSLCRAKCDPDGWRLVMDK